MSSQLGRQRLSLIQIGVGVLLALLAIAIEWIIFSTYSSNESTTLTFSESADFVTLLANVQSETLRLQAETERFIRDPSIGVEPLEIRRAFVLNQLRVAVARTRDNPPVAAAIDEFQGSLDEYDAVLERLRSSTEPLTSEEVATSVGPELDAILKRAIQQINLLYIREELIFDEKISEALQAQSRSQILLLGLSGLVLALTIGFALSLRRSVKAQFQQAYELVGSLEEAVAERTRDLARAAEVGQSLAAVRELSHLLEEAAALIHTRFALARTRIFLADAPGRTLLLRAEAGTQAQEGVRAETHLPVDDRSVEGRAALRQKSILLASSDLGDPTTLAVPLLVDERVVGILTLESRQQGELTEAGLPAFQVLAGQLAIAIENANLFAEIKRARAEVEAQARRLTHEGWATYLASRQDATVGFRYDMKEVSFLQGTAEEPEAGTVVQPLMLRGQPIGELRVARTNRTHSEEEALALVAAVANQLSAHIENLRLAERTERALAESEEQAYRLALLNEFSEQLTRTSTVEEIYQVTASKMRQLLPTDRSSVVMLTDVGELEVFALHGEAGMIPLGTRLPVEETMIGQVIQEKRLIITQDTQESSQMDARGLAAQGLRSTMCAPLIVGGQAIGTLNVASRVPESYTTRDAEILIQATSLLASALENRRLFQQLEEALAEAQRTTERLRELDRLKSAFLANMSHELRTPLNSIIGYTEVLLMGISGPLSPETTDDVEAIRTSSYHLLGLINDILDLAKIEAGHLTLVRQHISVESLLETIRANYQGLLHSKPISLVVEAAEALPPLWADSLRLSQVLTNLLSNAVKFTEQGTIWVRAYQEDAYLVFEVEDSGIGMNEKDLETIFEEFHQVDSSHARRAQGTGLGLAISRHLVQMHGGTIEVQSELGKGSTFIVRLPLDPGKVAPALLQEGN